MHGGKLIEQFLEQITPAVINLMAITITAIFGYVGTQIKKTYKDKINTEEKRAVVNSTVKYVEQVFKDIHGQEKLDKALETAEKLLNERGIPVSKAELTVLIESAVNALKNAE